MSIVRIITDVPPEEIDFVRATVEADNGRFEAQAQASGKLTVTATYPALPAPPIAEPPAQTPQSKWMQIALAELGQAELPGQKSNARIEEYHAAAGGVATDDVAWCSSFVNFCMERGGVAGTHSKSARSWLGWGRAASEPAPGAVVVLSRGDPPKGHVGFYVGTEGGRVRLLGGNQGNAVSIASFDAARIIGIRLAH
jgi:uncharacterized protein (TIGR02594 family)